MVKTAAVKDWVRWTVRRFGFDLVRTPPDVELVLGDLSAEERAAIRAARPYSMTSLERFAALVHSVRHVVQNGIPGDIVECGVWRGGSMMAAALMLKSLGDTSRRLVLYDTFEGMSEPTERDRTADGVSARKALDAEAPRSGIWCYASLEDVQANLRSTGYPEDKIVYVRGPVEQTIPKEIPERIALLRLDTDWYESTRHELEHLYPRLSPHGIMIIDDYGHWQGARAAVDEFLASGVGPLFLQRIDYTGRLVLKPAG
jgi:O-methyltransferase